MHWGSRAFVFVVFASLAASFWATTFMLFWEFGHLDRPLEQAVETSEVRWLTWMIDEKWLMWLTSKAWLTLATHYSDLFIFFPIFGTVALIAFYTPACAFVDMYWNIKAQGDDPIPYSRTRFTIGIAVVAAASFFISQQIQKGPERSLWQLLPDVLEKDAGQQCGEDRCGRVPFLMGIENVRRLSRVRGPLTDLARVCKPDNFIAPPREGHEPRDRYCAPSTNFTGTGEDVEGRWQSDEVCCIAQETFDDAVKQAHSIAGNRSLTDALQKNTWPLNIFFLVTLLAISFLLAIRRMRIEERYAKYARSIDGGVIIGVLAMAFLVVMNRGFLEATQLLHGARGAASLHRGPDTFMLVFAVWALIILFSFVHPANAQAELASRLLGIVFSLLFVFQAESITNFGVRHFGAGAGLKSIAVLVGVAISLAVVQVLLPRLRLTGKKDDDDDKAGASAEGQGQETT